MHPSYLGWQVDWPVFIKMPVTADNRDWKRGDHFNWLERGLHQDKVAILYASGYLYHNEELVVQTKVGDRLSEFSGKQLELLVNLLNSEVKRGLIRRFLNNNRWITEDYYKIRDNILGE